MPWSAYVIIVGLVLLAIPGLGEYTAVLMAFGSALLFAALAPALRVTGMFGTSDTTQIGIGLGLAAGAIAIAAVLLVRRLSRSDLTPQQESTCLNGLILVLGIPMLIGAAYWRLRGLWS